MIVGNTGCGKTTFVQNLGKNNLFGDKKEVYWISKIELSKEREENTRDCSKDEAVDFDYPTNVEDFNDLLEMYQQIKANYNENYLVRNMTLDRLIVMDDVSALADGSEEFANFLTVSGKYRLTCVYIFHTLYPTRQRSQMIWSQTKKFNFFPRSVQVSSIIRILLSFTSRYKQTYYVPQQNLWINRIYFEISNSRQKTSMTIDTCDIICKI